MSTTTMLSCQQLITELQYNSVHATTTIVDFFTLNYLSTQEASHVVILLATAGNLPRFQLTFNVLIVMTRLSHYAVIRASGQSVADSGWLYD